MRFYNDESTYAMTLEERLGPQSSERLFMISERQEWTFGQALEYALDALELALAKTATG